MSIEINKKSIERVFGLGHNFPWGLLLVVIIMFTIILYPDLVMKRQVYNEGDVVKSDIKAQRDFFYEDKEITEKNRKNAEEAVLTVYDHDLGLVTEICQRVHQAFSKLREVCEVEKKSNREVLPPRPENGAAPAPKEKAGANDRVWEFKEIFEGRLGVSVSDGAYAILEKESFSVEIENLIVTILKKILLNGVVANKEVLLREGEKGITLRILETKSEKIVLNLKEFYGPDQAVTMIRIVAEPMLSGVSYSVRSLVVDFAQKLITPNITLNRSETEERKKKAAEEVKPFLYQIKAGEMILREGERITKDKLDKVMALQRQETKNQIFMTSIGTALILLCLLGVSYLIHLKHDAIFTEITATRNKNLLFIACVLIAFVAIVKLLAPFSVSSPSFSFALPIAASAMTICLFMGLEIAVPFSLVISVCTAIIFKNKFDIFIYYLLSCAMGAYWMQHCRERKVFIKAGLRLGLFNIVLATAIDIFMADYSGLKLLYDWGFAFLGGFMAGIVTAGIAPLIEVAFDFTTDIKLLELANLDQPILRRLMLEAPGTYHHSVIVGTMVEAAASAIGANPLLARVCGYYHDIGKISKPLYFVENQKDGKNRHAKLAPSMSSLILIAHIKGGVEIAKENKLGAALIDAIQQHHGTSIISYFYEKAKQQKGDDSVKIDDFRYPGPKPQTKEVGLVMLADVLEAASRTLEDPTPSRIQGLVNNLINKVFSDGQLDNCELTLKDLNNIAKSFNKILNGIYHHRIEYPESVAPSGGKAKNGSSDKESAKQPQDTPEESPSDSASHLKRLGLS